MQDVYIEIFYIKHSRRWIFECISILHANLTYHFAFIALQNSLLHICIYKH